MPGATTARLVVPSFEMPMKMFMMPQTVPNRPTYGAVAPMVARIPVARIILRPTPASTRPNRADAFDIAAIGGVGEFGFHGADQKRDVGTCSRRRRGGVGEPKGCAERTLRTVEAAPDTEKLQSLGEPDRQGQHGGEYQCPTSLRAQRQDWGQPHYSIIHDTNNFSTSPKDHFASHRNAANGDKLPRLHWTTFAQDVVISNRDLTRVNGNGPLQAYLVAIRGSEETQLPHSPSWQAAWSR